jgi:hypothetical protein
MCRNSWKEVITKQAKYNKIRIFLERRRVKRPAITWWNRWDNVPIFRPRKKGRE